LQISAVQFQQKTHISGVVLESNLPDGRAKRGMLKNFITVIRSYALKTYNNREIIIRAGDENIPAKTDNYGSFSVEPDRGRAGEINVFLPGDSEPLRIHQDYPVFIKETDFPLVVISDIDDTIL